MKVAGSVNVGSFPRGKNKTINILNQFLSENLPPPEPMGGLFKCKILHKDRMRVRYQEPVIETRRDRQMEKDKARKGERICRLTTLENGGPSEHAGIKR